MGKGDSPRNNYSKQFKDNYDLINWSDNPICYNCGATISKDRIQNYPHLYTIHNDGQIEHKECNFN